MSCPLKQISTTKKKIDNKTSQGQDPVMAVDVDKDESPKTAPNKGDDELIAVFANCAIQGEDARRVSASRLGTHGSSAMFKVKKTASASKGLFATRDIPKGTLLLTEDPIIAGPDISWTEEPRIKDHPVRAVLEKLHVLPKKRADEFYNLYCDKSQLERANEWHRDRVANLCKMKQRQGSRSGGSQFTQRQELEIAIDNGVRAYAIFCTNAAGTNTGAAVYPIFSRINHSCLPNAIFYMLSEHHEKLGVRANQDIPEGKQIFVSHLTPEIRASSFQDRQASIVNWGFNCNCPACAMDAALERGKMIGLGASGETGDPYDADGVYADEGILTLDPEAIEEGDSDAEHENLDSPDSEETRQAIYGSYT